MADKLTPEQLQIVDARDVHVPASALDRMILEVTENSNAVKTLQKTGATLGAPLKGLLIAIVTLTIGATKFYVEWTQDRNVGTPALQQLKTDLEKEIADTRTTSLSKSDQLGNILNNTNTLIALQGQRIDQAEKRITRLEDKR